MLLVSYHNNALASNGDSTRISNYNDLCLHYCYNQPDSALYFIELGIALSKQVENEYLLAQAYNRKGIVFDVMNDWDSSMFYYDLAIDHARNSGNDKTLASALNNKGLIFWNRSEYEKALEYYQSAVLLFDQLGQKKGMANALNNIAVILQEQNRFDASLSKHREVLELYEQLDDDYGISVSYSNIGLVFQLQHQLDSARIYLSKSIHIKQKQSDLHGLAITYTNLSEVFEEEKQYDSAIFYIRKAIDIHRSLGDHNLVANNLSAIGSLYFTLKRFDESEAALLEALHFAREVGARKIESGIYQRLSDVSREKGDFEQAYKYMAKRMTSYAQVYEMEKDEMIAEITEKYEAQKKEKLIEQRDKELARQELKIKNRNIQLILIISGFCMLLLLGVMMFLNQKHKQNQLAQQVTFEKVEAVNRIQEEKLRISRDLHDNVGAQLTFVISTLDNLRYIPDEPKRVEVLNQLEEFTKTTMNKLRETVWALKLQDVSSEDLSVRIAEFLNQARKACPDVQFEIVQNSLSGSFDANEAIQIYRTIQEAVNNSIKHANPHKIQVMFDQHAIRIIDDGTGFDTLVTPSSHGIQGMKERMSLLGFQLNISSALGKGTVVEIDISHDEPG